MKRIQNKHRLKKKDKKESHSKVKLRKERKKSIEFQKCVRELRS